MNSFDIQGKSLFPFSSPSSDQSCKDRCAPDTKECHGQPGHDYSSSSKSLTSRTKRSDTWKSVIHWLSFGVVWSMIDASQTSPGTDSVSVRQRCGAVKSFVPGGSGIRSVVGSIRQKRKHQS